MHKDSNTATRTAFTTSRLMDFFSEKELVTQTGHDIHEWPLVCLKELVDNSLDACEEIGVPPVINVSVDDVFGITVTDNGPGIPADTVEKMLDFSVRVSSREAYVSPSRGAQGNALKTLVAMPFVLDGNTGTVEIITQGIIHEITAEVDRIKQEPVLTHEKELSNVKTGNQVRIIWPSEASFILDDAKEHFLQMAQAFAFLNPHLHLTVNWHGEEHVWPATDTEWKKWNDSMPSSAHWYDAEKLDRLIAGYVSNNPEKTVREFIAEFKGLKGTAKQKKVLASMGDGVFRSTLKDAFVTDGAIDREKVEMLLAGMREHSTPPPARALGPIGKDHIEARMREMNCDMETFAHQKMLDLDDDGTPAIAEVAFAMKLDGRKLDMITGVNWSCSIGNPFKKLGKYGASMDAVLAEAMVSSHDPLVMLIHMSCPSVKYSDHGKSSIVLED